MTTATDGAAELDRCSARSLARAEPMYGTASRVHRWVLLEEPGPWGRTALRDSRLPDPVARTLRTLSQLPFTKVLLVRRPHRSATSTETRRQLLVAESRHSGGWVRGSELGSADEVEDLRDELAAFGQDGLPPASLQEDDGRPLLLVCTHGRHDACCAELGRPLAAALASVEPARTWEVSHVGGDRFAGNVVVLPDGLYLGRVPVALAAEIARGLRVGRLPLPYLRGRSTYGVTTQAAEVLVRTTLRLAGASDLELVGREVDGDVTTATFRRPDGGQIVARVRGGHRAASWRLTCAAEHEDRPHEFTLESLVEMPPDAEGMLRR